MKKNFLAVSINNHKYVFSSSRSVVIVDRKNWITRKLTYAWALLVPPCVNWLTSLDMGWTNVHPDFQKSCKKIISHRFRVIKVYGLKILGAKVFRLFLQNFVYGFFHNHEFFCFFLNNRILHVLIFKSCCGAADRTPDYSAVILRSDPVSLNLFY